MSWIQTYSGKKFFVLSPRSDDLCIEDIAHSLSMMCRFAGHCTDFYSVGQHSILMSERVPEDHAIAALFHDASEAYLTDIPRPIKPLLSGFKDIENKLHSIISSKFGFEYPYPPVIHEVDLRMLATERRDIMAPINEEWTSLSGVIPFEDRIYPLPPKVVEAMFMERYYKLRNKDE